jgi:hypothetical protein
MTASDHSRRSFKDRAAEQAVVLSVRPEPFGVLVLLFIAWLALQALRALGKAL